MVALTVAAALLTAACAGGQAAERFAPLAEATARRAAPVSVVPHVTAAEWSRVKAFYQAREHRPAWTSGNRPTSAFQEAVALLEQADRDALDPAMYDVEWLAGERDRLSGILKRTSLEGDDQILALELRTSAAVLRWARHLSMGRFNPARKELWLVEKREQQPEDLVAEAVEAGSVGDLPARLRPPHGEYEGMLALRRRYAELTATAWPAVPGTKAIREGQRDKSVVALRARLAAEGDLAGRHATDSPLLDAPVVAALQAFQQRHGLAAGGTLDAATRAALNVPAEERLKQIDVNIDRWRFLPRELGPRHIRVNIPDYYLGLVENGRVSLGMRAVIGARATPTPVLNDEMRHIVFSPYWNIPESIANDEVIPKLLNDPAYLDRNDIELVRVDGNTAEPVDPTEVDWVYGSDEGLRLRQRPGTSNALGHVKFVLSNHLNIYLHDTPADKLFSRVSRALSHGCVRVERPVSLAHTLLAGTDWTEERIAAAMDQNQEQWVKLETPVRVHLMYFTAWPGEDGKAQFRADIYGHDAAQARAIELLERRVRRAAKAKDS